MTTQAKRRRRHVIAPGWARTQQCANCGLTRLVRYTRRGHRSGFAPWILNGRPQPWCEKQGETEPKTP